MSRTLAERCRPIKLLALDVDGCLTTGGIQYVAEDASSLLESKTFHVRDGSALVLWHRAGRQSAILTGRESLVVTHRAGELGISHVAQGLKDKLAHLQRWMSEENLTTEQIAYVGDDLPDCAILRFCGLAVAVADACPEVRELADYITSATGGKGAIRETIELILRCQGAWPTSV